MGSNGTLLRLFTYREVFTHREVDVLRASGEGVEGFYNVGAFCETGKGFYAKRQASQFALVTRAESRHHNLHW